MTPFLALALSVAPSASAAGWHTPEHTVQAATVVDIARGALPARLTLAHTTTLAAAGGHTVRFEQRHLGLPVPGAQAAVHVRADGTISAVHSSLANALTVLPLDRIGADTAIQHALEPGQQGHTARLVVLPLQGGVLAWDVRVSGPGDLQQVLVDASSGAVLARRSTLRHALGRVYEQNAVVTPTPVNVPLIALDAASPLAGFSDLMRVEEHVSGDLTAGDLVTDTSLVPNSGEDYLYDPPTDPLDPDDAFAQVNAWHHMSQAREYFSALTGEAMDTEAWGLHVVVNGYQGGSPLDNAYFAPSAAYGTELANMVYIGQGTSFDFAVDADVFVHEFGHYISTNAVGYNQGQLYYNDLGLSPWGGAIDEGIADYFAASLFDSAVVGEASLASLGAERDLADDALSCSDSLTGEVHEDGKLIGAAGWMLREHYGAETADALVWGALTLMTPDSSLHDFALGLRAAAESLEAAGSLDDLSGVDAAIAHFEFERCAVIQSIDETPGTSLVWGLDLLGQFVGLDCATAAEYLPITGFFHYELPLDPDAETILLDVTVGAVSPGNLSWSLLLREGEPVGFSPGLLLPEATEYDFATDVYTTDAATIELDPSTFTPGATLYALVKSESCPHTYVTVTGSQPHPEPDDGGDDDGAGDDGTPDTDDTTSDAASGDRDDDKSGGCTTMGVLEPGLAWLAVLAVGYRRRSEVLESSSS